jgi:uncharacterized protein
MKMKCPVCKEIDLLMSERQGVEIDYCPNCRGVWLDRGELDKIIERSSGGQDSGESSAGRLDDDADGRNSPTPQSARGQRPRQSWLSNLMDFGD